MEREFKVGELFACSKGNVDLQQKDVNGKGEFFINSGRNNKGIKGRTDRSAKVFPANTITIDFLGNAYYRDFPYKLATHNHVFSLSGDVIRNKAVGLYLEVQFAKFPELFSHSNMATWNKIKDLSLSLPVTPSPDPSHAYTPDDIDWGYMERYIAELEAECIAELEAYLAATGLDDCDLTDEDRMCLAEDKLMREFVVGEVFEPIKASFHGSKKKQESVSRVQTEEFSLPLINCKLGNNGIMYYGRPSDFTSHKRVLGVITNGPPTEGLTYYHEKVGVYTDAYLIGLKGQEIASREIGLYLTTALNKSIHNERRKRYSRGDKATWKGKVETDPISLPVTYGGRIDFDYMERYIRAIEKLMIADVIKYKDRLKAATKQAAGI